MELSSLVIEGLSMCGESSKLGDRSFRVLVREVFDILLRHKDENALSGSDDLTKVDVPSLKQMYTSLVTLVLESVKIDCDNATMSSTLEDSKWSTDRIEYFSKVYEEKKLEVEAMLSSTGSSHPHVVDVDWRLDYYIKNNHMDKVNKPTYLITLKTEQSGCASGKDVQFSCSMEQLQVSTLQKRREGFGLRTSYQNKLQP
ncbi:COMM domain-containing protein 3 [Exaiptasia diaphana]|uniref:COMM domain-containing protein 3 n=1 Tax=Exaiptasia diaphana TaxID=2652724 RepID=A0A913WPT9_EXADI|nr:COMM domain-containing protein 3 [Exaiptasia diaphana]